MPFCDADVPDPHGREVGGLELLNRAGPEADVETVVGGEVEAVLYENLFANAERQPVLAGIDGEMDGIPGIEEMIAVEGEGGEGWFIAGDHPEMADAEVYLVIEQIDVLRIVSDEPKDVAKEIVMAGQEGKIEAQIDGAARECQGCFRGEVEAGAPVLDGLVVEEAEAKGGGWGLANGRGCGLAERGG